MEILNELQLNSFNYCAIVARISWYGPVVYLYTLA